MFKRILKNALGSLQQMFGLKAMRNFLSDVANVATDLPLPTKKNLEEEKTRLRRNLERENSVLQSEFDDVLAEWGIRDEIALAGLVKSKRRMRLCGMAIAFIFLGYWAYEFFTMPKGLLWRSFDGLACLSFSLAGLLIWLTSSWRLHVIGHRKFVPFISWLLRRRGNSKKEGHDKCHRDR
jgi:hypothetical protein